MMMMICMLKRLTLLTGMYLVNEVLVVEVKAFTFM
jgi:hypothetical protein